MNDQNPFNDIWLNVNNRLEDGFNDLTDLYASWEDTREDFDNFHLMYMDIKYCLQEIIYSCGDYVET